MGKRDRLFGSAAVRTHIKRDFENIGGIGDCFEITDFNLSSQSSKFLMILRNGPFKDIVGKGYVVVRIRMERDFE